MRRQASLGFNPYLFPLSSLPAASLLLPCAQLHRPHSSQPLLPSPCQPAVSQPARSPPSQPQPTARRLQPAIRPLTPALRRPDRPLPVILPHRRLNA